MTDIDIDFLNRTQALNVLKHIKASRIVNNEAVPHNTGVYLQSIPFDPITNLAGIDYKLAEERGYFKIDFLNVSAYTGIKDEEHLNRLLAIEPIWELLAEKEISDQLMHINSYHNLLAVLKPTSIIDLATILALIRPGKKHLLNKCINDGFDSIKDEVWIKPTDGSYYFKKSHSISYATLIVVQMNLLCEQLS